MSSNKLGFSRLHAAARQWRRCGAGIGLALSLVASLGVPAAAQAATGIGVISYWGTDASLYNQLPSGSIAVINPDSGIFVADGQTTNLVPDLATWQTLVSNTAARGVNLLGYVPTGYFNHGCNTPGACQTWGRIEAQVAAYFAQMPALNGIFFDEASPSNWSCTAFVSEYQSLRALVNKYRPGAKIAFNAAVPDNCVVDGTLAGEIAVLFESSTTDYTTYAAQVSAATATATAKGVQSWHLVYSVPSQAAMTTVVNTARQMQANLVYVTNIGGNWQAGENTWGSLPIYWASEVQQLTGVVPGVNWGNMTKKLVNSGSYLCLRGASSKLDQQACGSTSAWTMTVQTVSGLPYYQLRYGTQCATQASAGSTALSWAACSTTAASQMWAMKTSGSLVYFENRQSAQVLSLPGTTAGTTAVAENYTGAAKQLFYFQ